MEKDSAPPELHPWPFACTGVVHVYSQHPLERCGTIRDAMRMMFPVGRFIVDAKPDKGLVVVRMWPQPPAKNDMHKLLLLLFPSSKNPGALNVMITIRDLHGNLMDDELHYRHDQDILEGEFPYEELIEEGWFHAHAPIERADPQWIKRVLVDSDLSNPATWRSIKGRALCLRARVAFSQLPWVTPKQADSAFPLPDDDNVQLQLAMMESMGLSVTMESLTGLERVWAKYRPNDRIQLDEEACPWCSNRYTTDQYLDGVRQAMPCDCMAYCGSCWILVREMAKTDVEVLLTCPRCGQEDVSWKLASE